MSSNKQSGKIPIFTSSKYCRSHAQEYYHSIRMTYHCVFISIIILPHNAIRNAFGAFFVSLTKQGPSSIWDLLYPSTPDISVCMHASGVVTLACMFYVLEMLSLSLLSAPPLRSFLIHSSVSAHDRAIFFRKSLTVHSYLVHQSMDLSYRVHSRTRYSYSTIIFRKNN